MATYKSIVDNGTRCFMCGDMRNLQAHHLLGGSTRKLCDEDKLIIALCFNCHRKLHDSAALTKQYRQLGQKYYEMKIGTREEWMKRYKKNYL